MIIIQGRYFRNNLTGVCGSSLVTACDALVQNLFQNATHTSASISVSLSNLAKDQALAEAKFASNKLRQTPKDIRTLYRLFDLNPKVTTYACCPIPTCCATYPPSNGAAASNNSPPEYPLRCTEAKFGTLCNELLVKDFSAHGVNSSPKPIKPFRYHHFHDHVAAMLARPGIEEAIQSHMKSQALEKELTDLMSAPILQSLVDHRGRPFLQAAGDELRLIWSLSADWYNPFSNKASGKVVSTGSIAMVCLSLPPDLRNIEDNVYLSGLIPGPHEPSVDATNHFLLPLINDLEVSYRRGIHYSQTYLHPQGRTSRSAIVPVIADTMASKKITGNCGHAATYFCSRCRLQRHCIDNLDVASWPRGLTREQHVTLAEKWRDARSKSAQTSLLKEHGIRWSPLLLLPYWQPSAWTITEAVHVILLGLIPRHCRDLLGLNFKDLPLEELDDDPPSLQQMEHARQIMELNRPGKLRSLSLKLLKFLCLEQGISLQPRKTGRRTKKEYIAALLVWLTLLWFFVKAHNLTQRAPTQHL